MLSFKIMAIGFLVSMPVFCQGLVDMELQQGRQYLADKQYKKAADAFFDAAGKGSGEAAYQLGLEFLRNELPPTHGALKISYTDPEYNMEKARGWMARAANLQYGKACTWMGWYMEKGYAIGKSESETSSTTTVTPPPPPPPTGGTFGTAFLYAMTNEANKKKNQTTTETHTQTDSLKAPDYEAAMVWYHKAADLNDSAGMAAIGRFYEKGLGVPVNTQLALKYYTQAVALGNKDAKARLDILSEQTNP